MSWNDHITSMKASGADDACICDQAGNIWAKSPDFNPSQQEIATMIKAAKGETIPDTEKLQCNGLPYLTIGNLENHTGRKFVSKNEGDKVLCSVALTKSAVVFATKAGAGRNSAVQACEVEAKYLLDSGL